MRLTSPDLASPWRLVVLAFGLGLAICLVLALKFPVTGRLGDTDDAMRLVMVRDLLAGRGWYDQEIVRLNPPAGTFMHWSRLLDGALAGSIRLFGLVVPPHAAETLTRLVWPLAWIFPAVVCALSIARNLGTRSAVFLLVPALLLTPLLYRQFLPGRIDHHNIQIVTTLVAMACFLAARDRTRWAAVAGGATALGLAIGLEALAFQALIGAGYALGLARDRNHARPAMAYGLSLAVFTLALFAAQTPPGRWSMSFCDALGINLVGGLGVAGLGLAATGAVAARVSGPVRIALLAAVGVLAAAAYIVPNPQCLAGPFAGLDPAIGPIWLNNVQEMMSLPKLLARERRAGLTEIAMMAVALAAGGYLLAVEWRRPRTGTLVMSACILASVVSAYLAYRMEFYVFWLGLPASAAALSRIAERRFQNGMVPSLIVAVAATPVLLGAAAATVADVAFPPPKRQAVPSDASCYDPRAYRPLAELPAGLVLANQDLGPFILAFTHDTAVAGPYHRLSFAIVGVHRALAARPILAEAMIRRLGVDYVVVCQRQSVATGADSLDATLRRGETPPWAQRLSAPKATLSVYRVIGGQAGFVG